ncbi:MAG: carbohydrate-binding domain-containing protein [Deltaproteobacteria bacterium]|nr:carbohydrate-binding domain-containing protein [Deltaproteobacteria bacterium]
MVTINGGNIHIVSSDDGLNGAGGVDRSGIDTRPGQGGFTPPTGGTCHLYINGGYIAVNAAGDGIDVNGSIDMTGGTVIVHGPTDQDNSAVDYDGTFEITGGLLVAAGSAGMAQAPGFTSTKNSLLLTFNTTRPASSLVRVQSVSGEGIVTFAPFKAYQSLAFSSPDLITNSTYSVYSGGSFGGASTDGLYGEGTYTPGTLYRSFTVTGVVTNLR